MKHDRPEQDGSRSPASSRSDTATRLVGELHDVGAMPETVRRVTSIADDPMSDVKTLKAEILSDPAIALRILRVVNSALCGMRGRVDSVDQAIKLLGFEAVRQITVATSVLPLFRDDQIHRSFNVRDLLTHAQAVAAGTTLLATEAGIGTPASAYLAGLLHDVGILVAIRVRRKQLTAIVQQLDEDPTLSFRQAEREILGTTHEALGEALCRRWRLPVSICHAARHHHRPDESGRRLTSLVLIADILAARNSLGYGRTVETYELPETLLRRLDIAPALVAEVEQQIPEALNDFDRLHDGAA